MMGHILNFIIKISNMEKYIRIAFAISILSLCGWIWVQSQEISSLKAETQKV